MLKTNKTEEVNNRINEILAKRAADIKTADEKEEAARAQLALIEEELKAAAEAMDAGAYEKALTKKHKINITLEMLRDRRGQIKDQEYLISEVESDAVIDSLLKFEDELAAEFEKDIAPVMKQLTDLYKEYAANIYKTEETITKWTNKIHAYYKTSGGSRADKPQAVHFLAYTGSDRAERLRSFLIKEKYFDGRINTGK